MANTGSALMGIGQARGENKAEEAVRSAVNSNLLETSINGAKGIVFTITGGSDLSMMEVSEAARIINSLADEDAKIIFGAVIDERLKDELKVTIVATGFSDKGAPANDFSSIEPKTKTYSSNDFTRRNDEREKIEEKKEEEVKESKAPNLNFSWFEKKEKDPEPKPLPKPIIKPQSKKTDDDEDEELSVPAFIRKKMM
jgi:cell division protein FtsZ